MPYVTSHTHTTPCCFPPYFTSHTHTAPSCHPPNFTSDTHSTPSYHPHYFTSYTHLTSPLTATLLTLDNPLKPSVVPIVIFTSLLWTGFGSQGRPTGGCFWTVNNVQLYSSITWWILNNIQLYLRFPLGQVLEVQEGHLVDISAKWIVNSYSYDSLLDRSWKSSKATWWIFLQGRSSAIPAEKTRNKFFIVKFESEILFFTTRKPARSTQLKIVRITKLKFCTYVLFKMTGLWTIELCQFHYGLDLGLKATIYFKIIFQFANRNCSDETRYSMQLHTTQFKTSFCWLIDIITTLTGGTVCTY